MKKIILIIVTGFFIFSSCGKNENKTTDNIKTGENTEIKSSGQNNSGEVVEIKLPTMQCSSCKKNIEGAVKKIDGVTEVNVVVKDKVAKVNFDKSKTDLNKIEGAIVMAGYQANDKPADKKAYDKLDDCCKTGGH